MQAQYRHMDAEIEKLTVQVAEQAEHRSGAQLLMTHPGVGPVTALATEVFLGDPQRFAVCRWQGAGQLHGLLTGVLLHGVTTNFQAETVMCQVRDQFAAFRLLCAIE